MRLWSLHPRYLDPKGLVALWREGLLAQKVLLGQTSGYRNHPQLERFKQTSDPVAAIGVYLEVIASEAERRGYHFDRQKVKAGGFSARIPVTNGQVHFEFCHLLRKLAQRAPDQCYLLKQRQRIHVHPLFARKRGGIADWEVGAG